MRQKWGQNFLADADAARRIVEALGPENTERVLEIGPGKGALTQWLMGKSAGLTLVELDAELARVLQSRWGGLNQFDLIRQDFLKWPLPDWPERSVAVISNLPYSAANAILRRLLDWSAWKRAVVMVQREVADRIVAAPDTPAYGLLSLAVQGKARVQKLFDVSPRAFRPPPKVTSTVLRLEPLPRPLIVQEEKFFKTARAAFSQRRKMLLNSLAGGLDLEKSAVLPALERAGLDPARRPQTLTLEEFNRLAEALPLTVEET
jgi:16S rRNA (adenine1518-N6/adenine1519-N6)-dimethyltransferase